jgi:hypothetical protein
MTRIIDLTQVATVEDTDEFPIGQASSGRTRSVAFSTVKANINAEVNDAVIEAVEAAERAVLAETALRNDLADGVTVGNGADLVAFSAGETLSQAVTADRVFDADLQDSTDPAKGAAIVGYLPKGTGAVGATARNKLSESVSVKDFGAVGDGVADDTAAIHAAIDYAKLRRASVFVPAGVYRVTSGYTQSTTRRDVHIFGEGSTREWSVSDQGGSHIRLDSTDPASFFYRSTTNHNVQVDDIMFSCAQFVQDRAFFKFGSNTSQFFTRVNFESVERPVVWPVGSYFQNSAYRDVQFRNSGTFHSETETLISTLLVLDNINHEGSIPQNTEKVGCNLSGIRQIQGTNFLLEGTSPGTGWTILKLGTTLTSIGLLARLPILMVFG